MISVDIGAHWTPALADLNNDGLLEMIIGESLGNLNYFEQDSINAGTFSLVDESWLDWNGGIYVHPFFTDLNGDSLLDLLISENDGNTYHLVQDDTNSTTFHQVNDNFGGVDVGESAVPWIIDIDDDNKLDFFVGEWYNGLYHYEQADTVSEEYVLISDQVLGVRDFGYGIGYTLHDIDGDSLLDMLVSANKGWDTNIEHYEQIAQGSLNFTLIDDHFNDIIIWKYHNLAIYDINGNGLLDLFVGKNTGYVSWYEQDELNSYDFSIKEENFNDNMKINQCPHLTFSDIDGDSLIDMIAGEGAGLLHHYEQDSIHSETFTKLNSNFLNTDFGSYSAPEFTDINGDSLLDLIIGYNGGKLKYYEQDSTNSENFSLITQEFGNVSVVQRSIPRFFDINNDGIVDLFVGDNAGGITLHLRNDDMDITPPDIPQNLAASVNGNYVDLSWISCKTEDLYLYNIYRSTRNDTAVAEYLYSVDFDVTSFNDSSLTQSGTYYYWLTALDLLGNESAFSNVDSIDITIVGIKDVDELILNDFALYQNYPNPFNPATTIRYTVGAQNLVPQHVDLSIYNTLGQKVATLVNKKQSAGSYQVKWNASGLSSGVYLYRLQAGDPVQTKKMVLMK